MAATQVKASCLVTLCLATLLAGSFCQCPARAVDTEDGFCPRSFGVNRSKQQKSKLYSLLKPPSDPKARGRRLPAAHVLFTLICPKKKVEMTSTPQYAGRSLSHDLSLVFRKDSLDQQEQDISCDGLARPLISEAVSSQEISGCLRFANFCFYYV